MKVIIYSRVSTGSQDVDRQVEELLEYSKKHNYEVVKSFTEVVSGAKSRKQRIEMSKLLEYIEKEKDVNGVLVWELSRLGRNTLDVLEILGKLTEKKVWVYSLKDNLCTLNEDGTESPTTKLTLTLLSGISTLERETIISRSVSGLNKAVSDGNWLGGKFLPYGYRREDKKLVIEEEESDVVKLIFELYLSGNGTKRIANELNRQKIPTRYNKSVSGVIKINGFEKRGEDFKWKDGTVYSILTNTVYIGKKVGKGRIEGKLFTSPTIIDEEVFSKVQFMLTNSPKPKRKKFFYLFEDQLRCGVCGRTYYPHKRSNNKDNRYVCLSKRYDETCTNYGISITKMNNGVWSLLRHSERELSRILENNSNKEELELELKKTLEKRDVVFQELRGLETKEAYLVNLLLDDKIDRKIYDEQFNKLRNEKNVIKSTLDDFDSDIASKRFMIEKQSDINRQIRNIKDDKRLLKKAIQNVVERIVIYPVMQNDFQYLANAQDRFVYVEVFTFANNRMPLSFCISQRGDKILFPSYMTFDKSKYSFINSNDQEEEEGEGFKVKKLFHLSSLD
jgi:DNA invertase Pin-like site-specific DNA recombinase